MFVNMDAAGGRDMAIVTVKFTKRKAVFIIIGAAVLLALLVLLFSQPGGNDVRTAQGRVDYLSALGWEVDPASEECEQILLPKQFENVLQAYNELQLDQGFDLEKYAGLECSRYTYQVTNYPNGDLNVLAQLFVYGNHVIGGDIHSTALDGFMHGLK